MTMKYLTRKNKHDIRSDLMTIIDKSNKVIKGLPDDAMAIEILDIRDIRAAALNIQEILTEHLCII